MRRLALPVVLVVLGAAAPAAQAARVDLMVAGKSGVLRPAKPVKLKAATVRVGGRRCRVGARTPLAALARTGLKRRLDVRDYGRCSRRPADGSGLYLRGIGAERARGADGWVYKVGRRVPSAGAGDPSARLRGGQRLLWFWCDSGADGCRRTLEVSPAARSAAAGSALRVTVRAYDDQGRGIPAAGAVVRLGPARATAGSDGVATITVPSGGSRRSLSAVRSGTVPAFPVRVRVR